MKPVISVIVPCYNQSQFLAECLQSVLNQTFKVWECIIVDDGSVDNTEETAKQWTKKDARFSYYKKENGGVASARNYGIERASGEWILPLDGDDKIGPRYMELASKEFADNPDIIYCTGQYFGEKDGMFALDQFDFGAFLLENQIFCSSFFKKEAWEKNGGFDTDMKEGYEDWEFWIRILKNRKPPKVVQLNEVGFYYRINTSSRNTDVMKTHDEELRNYIYAKHPEVFIENISNFKKYYHDAQKLEKENQHLKKLTAGKRYKMMNRILKIFGK